MKKGGGRLKGSSYERQIAKLFSDWYGKKVTRTPLSGGWGNSSSFGTQGDLLCQGGWCFIPELKKQEGWHVEQLLTGEKCPIKKWWKQAVGNASGTKKIPLLVFSRNHQPSFLMIKAEDWYKVSPNWENMNRMEAYMEDTNSRVFLMLLEDFFSINPPKGSPNRNAIHMANLSKRFKRKKVKEFSNET